MHAAAATPATLVNGMRPTWLHAGDDCEWISTFPFPSSQFSFLPIPISKLKSHSHIRGIPNVWFLFPFHFQTRTAKQCKRKQSTAEQPSSNTANLVKVGQVHFQIIGLTEIVKKSFYKQRQNISLASSVGL